MIIKEIWLYRGLLYFIAWRDIKIRYKQTFIGFVWAIFQPVFMTLIFSLFFGMLAGIPSEGIPYPLFSFVGLLPWTLFANGVTRASGSLVQDSNLIQKVYFPRILLPISSIFSPLTDFVIGFVALIVLMFYYGYLPSLMMLWVIMILVLELSLIIGLGLWLSAINVEYRDVTHVIPFLLQLLLFASPIIYSSSFVPTRFQFYYRLFNPMSGVIDGFRWAILGTEPPNIIVFASVAIIGLIFFSGFYYFKKREKIFVDVI